jgi:hypothetical protein
MKRIVVAILVGTASPALAWDGPGMWYRAADDANPGGGGILGTGGAHDHGIKCTDCHVDRKPEPGLAFALTFAPALANTTYAAGTRYTVTAKLTGAQLARPCTFPNGKNNDGFAASFEDDAGASAGTLAADDGQSAPSCTLPSPPPPGTTALDGDCKVVFANGAPDTSTWTFFWTAPSSGAVHVYWGAVDGDCDMMSMNDAAVTGSMTLAPPSAAAQDAGTSSGCSTSRGDSLWLAALALFMRRRRATACVS